MVENEAEAEDLTQEVFLQLFRKMDTFRGESAFSTWLYRLAVNVVLMRLRKRSIITHSLEKTIEVKDGVLSLQQVLGAPDSALTSAIDRLTLERAVARMPAGYKRVFMLHYVEGYAHRDIARLLGLSVGTSKSQLFKARVRLRQLIGGALPDGDEQKASNPPVQLPYRTKCRARKSLSLAVRPVDGKAFLYAS
jgi:RNA polymerase sigma-70 factor (ECF subfamily)